MKAVGQARQEVLAPNAFIGKKEAPTEAELAAALGPAKPRWEKLVAGLVSDCPQLVQEWKCSSPKLGWGLRLQLKQRNIIHLAPCKDSFRVGFVFGEKALQAVREAFRDTAPRILELIAAAPKYAEGTGVRIDVRDQDVDAIRKLARIKASH